SLLLRLVPDVARQSFSQKPTSAPPPPPPGVPPPPPPAAPPSIIPPPPPPDATGPRARPSGSRPTANVPPLPGSDLSVQLEEERTRRKQAEAAVLTVEQRATHAEGQLAEAENRLQALEQR